MNPYLIEGPALISFSGGRMNRLDFSGGGAQKKQARRFPDGPAGLAFSRIVALQSSRKGETFL